MAPRMPLALTKLSRSLTSLKYHGAKPRSISSGAENQRTVRTFSLLPGEAPSTRGGPESQLCLPILPMAGLAQQPPQGIGPSPNTLPTLVTSWQLFLTPSAPPGPTVRMRRLLPPMTPHN